MFIPVRKLIVIIVGVIGLVGLLVIIIIVYFRYTVILVVNSRIIHVRRAKISIGDVLFIYFQKNLGKIF